MLNAGFNFYLIAFICFPLIAVSQKNGIQNNNNSNSPKNFINIKFGADDPWIGVSYERLMSKHIGAEAQIGAIGVSIGAKIYLPAIKKGRVSLYAGILEGWGAGGRKTYFPIGINILSKRNYRLSLDAGPRIWHSEDEDDFLGFSIKIGKGF